MFDSVNICALHKNRKDILQDTLNIYFPNQPKVEIKSIDTSQAAKKNCLINVTLMLLHWII